MPLLEGGANRFSFHTHDLAADNGEIRDVNTTCGLRKASEMSKLQSLPLQRGTAAKRLGVAHAPRNPQSAIGFLILFMEVWFLQAVDIWLPV
ncbi:MAG: hypothetical protein DMG13_16345 [Acidobacteria bacterium]|nr:MAG: hypothetical protein DMG13_16345 [Acidobacteriota bacterium]